MPQTKTIFDPEGVIKGVDISTTYISGLQSILMTMFSYVEDKSTLPATFAKFKKIAEGDDTAKLTQAESQLYIIVSLIQTLKLKATQQELSKEIEISDDINSKVEAMSKDLMNLDEEDADALQEFTNKYQEVYDQVAEQLSKDKSS